MDFDKYCVNIVKLMRFDLSDYSESMSYALADEELSRRYSKASSDIRDHIVREYAPQGMDFNTACRFFDSSKAEFVPIGSGRFCYVRPDRDAALKELVDNAKKLFRAKNKVHAESGRIDKRIISSIHRSCITKMQARTAFLLNIPLEDASRLVREDGELTGRAATSAVADDSRIKTRRETAKTYYDILCRYDNMSDDEKYRIGNITRTYCLNDIKISYEQTRDKYGTDTARKLFEQACKEEGRDPKAIAEGIGIDY